MANTEEKSALAVRLRAVASRNPDSSLAAVLAGGLAKGLETGVDAFGNPNQPGDMLKALHGLKGMVSGADVTEVDDIAKELAKFIWK